MICGAIQAFSDWWIGFGQTLPDYPAGIYGVFNILLGYILQVPWLLLRCDY